MPPPQDPGLLSSEQEGLPNSEQEDAKTSFHQGRAYSKLAKPGALAAASNVATGIKSTQDIPAYSTSVNALRYIGITLFIYKSYADRPHEGTWLCRSAHRSVNSVNILPRISKEVATSSCLSTARRTNSENT